MAATVLAALLFWPVFGSSGHERTGGPTPAPVMPDYLYRDKTIAFYEMRVRRDPQDQISARMLAGQYMQRYRESSDIDDIKRALVQARRSIALQPANSSSSYEVAASGETALHLFAKALADERYAHADRSDDMNAVAQIASLDMELGRYDAARAIIRPAAQQHPADAGLLAVLARYEEMTGHLKDARAYLSRAAAITDSVMDNPAQARAWFHFRAGEMAFSAGAVDAAKNDERTALTIFPRFAPAFNALARFCWATQDWGCALENAEKGAAIVPLPETLGYEADAQRALGDVQGATRTVALIGAIERIGNAYHVSDRLLAVYYTEHNVRLPDALKMARREVDVRGGEVYAQDTLAWAAAKNARWQEARIAMDGALRYGTEDPRLFYHAGVIAEHLGQRTRARADFARALALNPHFHPTYADDARTRLSSL
ncbi:MAG: hypothetical protein DLM50_05350 [Candidatus Meridianibacter frigidus]|nr:MAG: hypothetical protein DLM50_05350 [Candidatus Eremiobacteraeota bacterium]